MSKKYNFSNDPSPIKLFRDAYLKKKIELIDITQHLEFRLGRSGSCNSFNEPNEEIYHIQVLYRNEPVANFSATEAVILDDDKYCIFVEKDCCGDEFIFFRKVKI